MTADRGKLMMRELAAEILARAGDLNEATTRRRLIDRLLTDVLGWPASKTHFEARTTSGEYMDYVLGEPSRMAVVEAKREGRHFTFPASLGTQRSVSLQTLREHSAQNRAAIDQVLAYGKDAGLPVAVLTNGHQLIAFLASRQDGVAPISGRAVVYTSVEAMQERFLELWDQLSEPGLRAGTLRRELSRSTPLAPPPDKLSAHIANYPGFRSRTALETDLSTLADLFLVDIMQDKEVSDDFVRECYCTSGALSQYSSVSKELLRYRYEQVRGAKNVTPVAGKKGTNRELTADAVSAAMSNRPIVLLGDVGVGKTFFLRHLVRVDAADVLKSAEVVYIDFLRESGLVTDVGRHVVREVKGALRDRLDVDVDSDAVCRKVYRKELQELENSIYGRLKTSNPAAYEEREVTKLAELIDDSIEHLRRNLETIRAERRTDFVLILDNLDHHPDDFQEGIFILGQSLAQKWPVTVFISLRPDTFHRSQKQGSLAAYQPRVFAVPPPRVDAVIQKRLKFAHEQLLATGRLESFPEGLTISSDSLATYIDVLLEAFTERDEYVELIDNMSSGNVRQALGMLSQFVGSGYVSIERILELDARGHRYVMPFHEILRALLFGEGDYYDPTSSPIPNVFDLQSNDGMEHFLCLELLTYVEGSADHKNHGYVLPGAIYDHLQALGYTEGQIAATLEKCASDGLLQHAGDAHDYRITQAGAYMRKKMVTEFPYLDAVVVDVPILNPTIRGKIGLNWGIHDRLQRAATFLDYLDEQWAPDSEGFQFSWPDTSARAKAKLESVRTRAERNRN